MGANDIEPLRILLVGNGGREHALAWKLNQSPLIESIHVAPGNGGTAGGLPKVENLPNLQVGDFPALVEFSLNKNINLLIPGPEQPLVDGIVDFFRERVPHIRIFGPGKLAAQLEGSKAFAKDFMTRHKIPTARYQRFKNFEKAQKYINNVGYDIVIKATGLAAGKGVVLPATKEEARAALKEMMLDHVFGSAGNEVVIEEKLAGQEISILSFCDGYSIQSLPPAQDHKQINDGDTGPNTGGMGCYGPAQVATPEILQIIQETVLQPTMDGMRKEKCPFTGLLFTGFMITQDGPRVLEYNVRFGDPETQTLLPLMNGDLAEVIVACTDGYLDSIKLEVRSDFAATVIAAAGGYPGSYGKGELITIDENAVKDSEHFIFHAGTSLSKGSLTTSGGRVIAATCTAPTLKASVSGAYSTMKKIRFSKMHYRTDIAHHALTPTVLAKDPKDMTYASAGVSIASGNALVDRIRPLVASTARPGAPAQIGGFGGSFNLAEAGYEQSPTLVTGTDGVGTKLMIAHAAKKHDTIGIDLVAMNVNDIVVCGAEPLYLTDVYSCHSLNVNVATEVVKGICAGCIQSGCALLGGETAEMGNMFFPGEYDVTATTTGAIAQGQKILPDKSAMREGDVLLGLASSGCHSNGFSLIRKILEKSKLGHGHAAPWLEKKRNFDAAEGEGTATVGEALLQPTRIYVKPLLRVVAKDLVKGMAHITGGGLVENVPRMLPKELAAEMDASTWPVPAVLKWLKKAGDVSDAEFAKVFNTGLGMVLVVGEEHVDETARILREAGETVYRVGCLKERVTEGCIITNTDGWL